MTNQPTEDRAAHVEREAVARALAAHRSWPDSADGCIGCGWKPDRADFAGRKHALHVADAVLAALPQTGDAAAGGGLDLAALRETNTQRCARWHGPDTEPWSLADWSNAMAGEAGEACNEVKKIRRIETRTGSANPEPREDIVARLANELADVVIYADLVAANAGIDLSAAVVAKFNAVSVREGFPERLALP